MKALSQEITILGRDPDRVHRINANSFQQNAITTVNDWQYAAFYTQSTEHDGVGCCINVARRLVPLENGRVGIWQKIQFRDYQQTADDGHNTISVGVCAGDDTIHLAFDHHCNPLNFRMSRLDRTRDSSVNAWNESLFEATRDSLPGCGKLDVMKEVTYPRFLNVGEDLILTYRIGQAGSGSDVMYRYSSKTHRYTYLGEYLTGVSNSPYINGIDFKLSRIHISWCYRNFVSLPDTASIGAHRQQVGFNGPENNFDLNYAFSEDLGESWKNSSGDIIAVPVKTTIRPDSDGVQVFEIQMKSGILNQEGQVADLRGGFWVLNREKVDGEESWMVYHRDVDGKWNKIVIHCGTKPTETGSRGSMCADRAGNIYCILPGNTDSSLNIMVARQADGYETFEPIWMEEGFDGEPLVDTQRLETSNVLSIFTRTYRKVEEESNVVVIDILLGED